MAAKRLDILIGARDNATRVFGRINRAFGSFTQKLTSLPALAAGALGGVGLASIVKQSVDAFAEQEKAVANLSDALKAAGDETAASLPGLARFASKLQSISTIGDEATLKLAAFVATLTGQTGTELEQFTLKAAAVGRALNQNAESVAIALNRIQQGETSTALDRFIPQLKQAATQAERFDAINAVAAKGLQQLKSDAGTTGGRIQQMNNALGDTSETIGAALAPTLANLAQRLTQMQPAIRGLIADFTSGLGVLRQFGEQVFDVDDLVSSAQFVIENFGDVTLKQMLRAEVAARQFGDGAAGVFSNLGEISRAWLDDFASNWTQVFKGIVQITKNIFEGKITNILDGVTFDLQLSYFDAIQNAVSNATISEATRGAMERLAFVEDQLRQRRQSFDRRGSRSNDSSVGISTPSGATSLPSIAAMLGQSFGGGNRGTAALELGQRFHGLAAAQRNNRQLEAEQLAAQKESNRKLDQIKQAIERQDLDRVQGASTPAGYELGFT